MVGGIDGRAAHLFILLCGVKAPRMPLEAADQRSGARGAGRRIHRCWPASRGCQPAACGRHRLWNVAIGSVDASISHGAHPVRSLVDPSIEAVLLTAGGVGSSTFFAPVGCVHARESRGKVWRPREHQRPNAPTCDQGETVVSVWHSGVVGGAQWGFTSHGCPRVLKMSTI